MMKATSQRERVMLVALPSGILFLCYFFFVATPLRDELKETRRLNDVAKARVPKPGDEAKLISELRDLEDQVRRIRSKEKERVDRINSGEAYWSDEDARAKGGAFIGQVLAENGVVLVEELIVEEEEQEAFATVIEALPSTELWKLRLAGSYDSMRKTVAKIGASQLPLLPAGIEMEPKGEGNKTIHLWNLWICR